MVRSTRELQLGWVISFLFHAGVAVLLLFSTFQNYIPEPQVVEMTWGDINSLNTPMPDIPAQQTAAREEVQDAEEADNSVALPARNYLDLPDDVISINQNKKSISADAPSTTGRSGKITAEERQTTVLSSGLGTRENAVGRSQGTANVQSASTVGSGSRTGGLGENVGYAVQWAGGGNRKLLSGDVPGYPPGVNVAAQIKLRVRVMPDGSVRSVAPAQKGDTRLENAAIGKVKLWRFEPLLSAQVQAEQECTITFNFTLK